jgi:hypothetical protein
LIAKIASASGKQGLSTILHTRDVPLPFLNDSRVVEACAMMFPPLVSSAGPDKARLFHSHWLLRICSSELTAIDLSYDLICNNNSDTELSVSLPVPLTTGQKGSTTHLVCEPHQRPQEFRQVRLSR